MNTDLNLSTVALVAILIVLLVAAVSDTIGLG